MQFKKNINGHRRMQFIHKISYATERENRRD